MTTRLRYDYNMLKSLCDKNNVTLLEDYSSKYITRDTRIIAKCILCENSFNKSLNKLHKQCNFGCETCSKKIIRQEKIKKTMVEKYGVEFAAQSELFMNKMKATSKEKYGVEHPNQSEEVKEKIKKTNNEKYGCDYGLQNKEVKEKRTKTNLEKYGVEHQLQRKEVIDKIKETNLERYGATCCMNNEEVKKKIKETNLERYGFEYGFQSEEIKSKIKETNLERYGVEYNLQRKEVIDKIKETNLKKYGVEYIMQSPEIMEKSVKNSYYLKEYTLPSGNIIKIQGYEHYALDELLKNYNENEIITGTQNVPEIWYIGNDSKKHRHFVDIFIPSINKCIEVKSTWTYKTQKEVIFLKQSAAKDLGYLYEIWVYDKGGLKVETFI
jgi:hypothetical protein